MNFPTDSSIGHNPPGRNIPARPVAFDPPPGRQESTALSEDTRPRVTWVEPAKPDWRLSSSKVVTDKHGRRIERRTGTIPRRNFDPGKVRQFDRIGRFTVISPPFSSARHANCHQTCEQTAHVYANVQCDCGWVIPAMSITGDALQWVSCGCANGSSPENWGTAARRRAPGVFKGC
jgi:hypothetical protein